MRTIQIYKFNELRPEVQRKVITKNISPVMNVTRKYLEDVWSELVKGLAGSELILKDSVIVDSKHQVWFARLDTLSYYKDDMFNPNINVADILTKLLEDERYAKFRKNLESLIDEYCCESLAVTAYKFINRLSEDAYEWYTSMTYNREYARKYISGVFKESAFAEPESYFVGYEFLEDGTVVNL